MQTISGSVNLSLGSKEIDGASDLSSETGSDMASGLGFLALFATHIQSATTDFNLSDLIKGQLVSDDPDGKLFPQGLPLRSSFTELLSGHGTKQFLERKMLSSQELLDALQGEGESDSLQSLVQELGNKASLTKGSQAGATGFAAITNQLGSHGWGDELASRVKWQIGQEIQEAKISLNPRELGPLQVKINIIDDQAHVHFVTHHGSVRDAIEDAIPRMREMLEQSGMVLADAGVSQQAPDQRQSFFESANIAEESENGNESLEEQEQQVKVIRKGVGLLDAFI